MFQESCKIVLCHVLNIVQGHKLDSEEGTKQELALFRQILTPLKLELNSGLYVLPLGFSKFSSFCL